MYYPLYNNPFYYPTGAYMNNMCSYGHDKVLNANYRINTQEVQTNQTSFEQTNAFENHDFFSIQGDRLEVFGISINIDDLIILIMLFFMFRENQIDYSIIIILALILFDQS